MHLCRHVLFAFALPLSCAAGAQSPAEPNSFASDALNLRFTYPALLERRSATMAIATNWNNHLLVWFMTANSIATLDQLSKSLVRFGRAAAAPLYPLRFGNANPAGSPQ